MTKKKSNVAIVKEFFQLSSKEVLIRDKDKKIDEPKDLWKLRRTLESRGLDPDSSELMNYAIILDNRPLVEGYLDRADDAEMHYARRSNGKNAGKIRANTIEADRLKELGIFTINPRTLANILAEMDAFRKSTKKARSKRRVEKRVNNMRTLNEELYIKELKEIEQEEDDEENDVEEAYTKGIDYDAITESVSKAFLTA